ncbi:hypothetical protein Mapa_006851 [Marchantia paleacea]|nr:hypothetical protein Mapa_006851 [Marchantia paleacea]
MADDENEPEGGVRNGVAEVGVDGEKNGESDADANAEYVGEPGFRNERDGDPPLEGMYVEAPAPPTPAAAGTDVDGADIRTVALDALSGEAPRDETDDEADDESVVDPADDGDEAEPDPDPEEDEDNDDEAAEDEGDDADPLERARAGEAPERGGGGML